MTEINKVKLLESLDSEIRYYFGLNDRNSSDVRLMLEALKTKVEKGRFDIEPSDSSSLITTIESLQTEYDDERASHNLHVTELLEAEKLIQSQKEEIERLMGVNQHLEIDLSESKAIKELAVKGLKKVMMSENIFSANVSAADILFEIERLTNGTT